MATLGPLTIKLSADATQMNNALTGTRARLAALADSLDRMEKGALGARGPIKDVFEILKGGGAVVGLSFGASVLRDMFEGANKLRNELEAGTISAGEFNEKLLQSLPVFGQIRQAGLAIREFFTEEGANAARLTAEAEAIHRLIDLQAAAKRALVKEEQNHLQVLKAIRDEMELMALPAGPGRESRAVGQRLEDFTSRRQRQAEDEVTRAQAGETPAGKVARAAEEARRAAQREFDRQSDYFAQAMARNPDFTSPVLQDAKNKLLRAQQEEKRAEQALADEIVQIRARAEEEITAQTQLAVQQRAKITLEGAIEAGGKWLDAMLKGAQEQRKREAEEFKAMFMKDIDFGTPLETFDAAGGEALQRFMQENKAMERSQRAAAELGGGAAQSIAAAERRFTFSTPSDRRSDPAEIAKRQEKLAAASLKEEQKSNGFLNTIAQKVAAGDSVGIFTITNN